jgi:dethiobiotin synthase
MSDVLTRGVVVAGTDTGIGKTVLSALLVLALDAAYWKPVQSGLEDETDTRAVARIAALSDDRVHAEAYALRRPLSPDQSAAADGVRIDPRRLVAPPSSRPLVIELAGGLLVPYSDDLLQIDVIRSFDRPVVLAARSGLGTLNHTLLSIEALRARSIPAVGVVLIGEDHPLNRATLARWSPLPVLGIVPPLATIDEASLRATYHAHFEPIERWRMHTWS